MGQRHTAGMLLILLVGAAFGAPAVLASEMVFESDGSSLDPFYCHYVDPAVVPTIDAADGLPAPSLEFATESIANYSFAPYVLPSLVAGQTLRGSLDFIISGEKNLVEIAGFGVSISASCDYDPDTGPADGRWPLPTIFYDSSGGVLFVEYRNKDHEVVRDQVPYELSLGSWHHAELTMVPAAGIEAEYDFELQIDGASVVVGRSAEELRNGDALGVLLGAVGSGFPSRVAYDNVQVELRDTTSCRFGPVEEPWTVTRGHGTPAVESNTWDSCGGRGTLEVTLIQVSSAVVFLNGSQLLGPSAFNHNLTEIAVPVDLAEGENRLEVELRSQPGSSFSVRFVPGERRNRQVDRLLRPQLLLHAPDHALPAHRTVRARAQLEVR